MLNSRYLPEMSIIQLNLCESEMTYLLTCLIDDVHDWTAFINSLKSASSSGLVTKLII